MRVPIDITQACISLRAHAQQVTPLGANDVSFARDLEINGWNIVAFTDERSLSSPTLSRLPVACLCVCACACMRVCTLFCTRIPIFMSTRAKNKGKGTWVQTTRADSHYEQHELGWASRAPPRLPGLMILFFERTLLKSRAYECACISQLIYFCVAWLIGTTVSSFQSLFVFFSFFPQSLLTIWGGVEKRERDKRRKRRGQSK